MNRVIYLETDDLVTIHDKIISEIGGLHGIHDEGLLDGALEMIKIMITIRTFR